MIKEAEQRWSIMMHHDAITGTHMIQTEKDYYNMLNEANVYLQRAYNYVNQNFGKAANDTIVKQLKDMSKELKNDKFDHYTIVNPTANHRSEVVNITLDTIHGDNDTYAVFIHYANNTFRSKKNIF